MRILLIDDEPESVEGLREELEERGLIPRVCGFVEAQEMLLEWRPAAVVLDLLLKQGGGDEDAGTPAFENIWNTRFCPIVVYSAEPERLRDPGNPFVKFVQKGRGSEDVAMAAIEALRPSAQALQSVAEQIDIQLHQTLTVVAPALVEDREPDRLTRAVLRHLAARLDVDRFGSPLIRPEEQYVYPPVHGSLLTGDLVRLRNSDPRDPSSYRLILTPSCDLVVTEGRQPKVSDVLLARCRSVTEVEEQRGKLERLLRAGGRENLILLPALGSLIPTMMADLKDLELSPIEGITLRDDGGGGEFVRVTSIDSPFREKVTWRYLQVAGRPGLPDQDVSAWVDTVNSIRESAETTGPDGRG